MLSVKTYFAGAFTKFLDNEVLLDESGVRFKYSDIQTFSSSKFFQALDRKLIICKLTNDAECLALYFALLASGAIPLLTSADIAESEYLKLLKAYQPAAELIPMFEKNHSADCFTHDSITKFSVRMINSGSTSYPINDELALLLPTSGSTGSAKYVRVSHENIISNTDIISSYLQIKEQDKVITTLPPNYSYGASVLHTHLSKGSSIVVTETSFFEKDFWKLLDDNKITTLNGVPFHYEMLRRLKFHKKNLSSLKTLTQAGGHLNQEDKKYFIDCCIDKNISFYVMYGQTEASPRISFIKMPDLLESIESIGKGIENCNLFLTDEKNIEISIPNQIGELNVSGKNIALGYSYTYEDFSKPNEFKGLLKTGDLAYFDNKGRFYIVGRKSRFVKIVGKRINLDDVQSIVSDLGYENVCTGNDSFIKIGCTNISSENIINLLRILMEKLNIQKRAIKIFAIDKIERKTSGKVAYQENDKKMDALL
tara:strand:- start:3297 stop:4742 length:1446 start_codon:yes stop_codon:yes gene_type:complete